MAILTIKNRFKEFVKLIYIYPNYQVALNRLRDNQSSKIILFGTPAHGNLGDQAIAISEMDFLRKISKERNIVEIPMPLFKVYRETIRSYINPKDTIIISGGGWMGNLWIHNEITIRQIIMDYSDNRIVIFPQTLYYTNDEYGNKVIAETKDVFCKHKDLILSVRDARSYECAEREFELKGEKELLFCPDMVVYGTLAQKMRFSSEDKSALICLRDDIEKKADTDNIKNIFSKAGYSIRENTTVLNRLIPLKKRLCAVQEKIAEFQSASIVVTDRLHAMLFATLAGTPCIAFDNATGKVFGVGEYLVKSGLPIMLVDHFSLSELENIDLKKWEYKLPDKLEEYFSRLAIIVNYKEAN